MRKYGYILGAANIITAIFIWLWFPDYKMAYFYNKDLHMKWVIATTILTGIILFIIIIIVWLFNNELLGKIKQMFIAVSVIQIIRAYTAIMAIYLWPGSDDGPGIGWDAFVIPSTSLNAIIGIIITIYLMYKKRASSTKSVDAFRLK